METKTETKPYFIENFAPDPQLPENPRRKFLMFRVTVAAAVMVERGTPAGQGFPLPVGTVVTVDKDSNPGVAWWFRAAVPGANPVLWVREHF